MREASGSAIRLTHSPLQQRGSLAPSVLVQLGKKLDARSQSGMGGMFVEP